jgi:hypothetical protein
MRWAKCMESGRGPGLDGRVVGWCVKDAGTTRVGGVGEAVPVLKVVLDDCGLIVLVMDVRGIKDLVLNVRVVSVKELVVWVVVVGGRGVRDLVLNEELTVRVVGGGASSILSSTSGTMSRSLVPPALGFGRASSFGGTLSGGPHTSDTGRTSTNIL